MSDMTTIRTCGKCGLHYRESLIPHVCANWTKGKVEDVIAPRGSDGVALCLCGWQIPECDVSFTNPYAGRYRLSIHCPKCKRVWDCDSADSKTVEHPANRAKLN